MISRGTLSVFFPWNSCNITVNFSWNYRGTVVEFIRAFLVEFIREFLVELFCEFLECRFPVELFRVILVDFSGYNRGIQSRLSGGI